MDFSARLKQLRQIYNISQKTLSDLLGISPRAFRFYESGEHEPTLKNLASLANYFGVSLDYLTGRNDDPRYEDFVINAERMMFDEITSLLLEGKGLGVEINGEPASKWLKDFYISNKQKYTSPLAHLRLIFASRELANGYLNPKTSKIFSNLKTYLQKLGFYRSEVSQMEPTKYGEKSWYENLIEELNRIEAEYKKSRPDSIRSDDRLPS